MDRTFTVFLHRNWHSSISYDIPHLTDFAVKQNLNIHTQNIQQRCNKTSLYLLQSFYVHHPASKKSLLFQQFSACLLPNKSTVHLVPCLVIYQSVHFPSSFPFCLSHQQSFAFTYQPTDKRERNRQPTSCTGWTALSWLWGH